MSTLAWVLLWFVIAEAAVGIVYMIGAVIYEALRRRREKRASALTRTRRPRHRLGGGHKIQL